MQPEQARQVVDPKTGGGEQDGCQELHQEFRLIGHTDQIIRHTRQEQCHHTHRQQDETGEIRIDMRRIAIELQQHPQAYGQTETDQKHREEGHTAQTGDRSVMHLPLIGDIIKFTFAAQQQDSRHEQRTEHDGQ